MKRRSFFAGLAAMLVAPAVPAKVRKPIVINLQGDSFNAERVRSLIEQINAQSDYMAWVDPARDLERHANRHPR
jgi:hypothetical protein